MPGLTVLDNPLIAAKMTRLRDKDTPSPVFRRTVHEMAALMSPAVFGKLRTQKVRVQTPLEETDGAELPDPLPCIVSILRAGNGLADALSAVLPDAAIGHLGMQRNPETHEAEWYSEHMPREMDRRQAFLVDPMLATGGSACAAAARLKELGCGDIVYACLLAAPEGVKALHGKHPDVPVITAAMDRELNESCYILPGLGDAGDRMYDTV